MYDGIIRNWNPREEGTFVLNHVPRNRDMISLVGIYLRGNRLKTIDMSVFSSMMSLSCLDLSENRVEHVEGTIASSNLTALRLSFVE
ncbi:uncharacterized protein LOC128724079 [Anopheles nili]|uniref:uncharacterized protein LOC128724079 n=1 Tax=Anopheles nili TaxID=185578 RepID=UPI00237B262D|nr:uncharacterized protein LOC128724079 [Anopheles nili]